MDAMNILKNKMLRKSYYCVTAIGLMATPIYTSTVYAQPDEIEVNAHALDAYKKFWDAFSEYERSKAETSVVEFERAKNAVLEAYEKTNRENLEERSRLLSEGVEKYDAQLRTNPTATNRPYVMLNLSKILLELSGLQREMEIAEGSLNRQRAMGLLREIDVSYPDFEFKNEASYQRAVILESIGERDQAIVIWQKLADTNIKDRYALHANLAAGDWEFERASPDVALKYYQKAKDLVSEVPIESRSIDELRIYYRIGWAAYKATKLDLAIQSAKKLLSPGTSAKAARQQEKIVRDASELVGFSLYEQDDLGKLKVTVRQPEFSRFGAAIILTAMTRYQSASQNQQVADLGAFAAEHFGVSKEIPDIIVLAAQANKNLKKEQTRMDLLESLAALLPENSLWRNKHKEQLSLIKSMETQAKSAALSVAAWYYENGVAGGSQRAFKRAAGYFDILISDDPNATDAIDWRLKRANCALYSGGIDDAVMRYNELITGLKISDETLSIAMYQRTIALERKWRGFVENNTQKGRPVASDPQTLEALRHLEASVEEHANKFPNQSRSIDLLLVAASANRDHNRFVEAATFWQRSLLGSPTDVQRAMAIRGLVFAELRKGKPIDVINMVTKFLQLESSKSLSQNLAVELHGVLASAAREEANQRAKNGDNEGAGDLLVAIAREFKQIPGRELLLRDGAYMQAIGGNWQSAERSADNYLAEGNKKYWGDLTYLKARSAEYQMRFPLAVTTYISLAKKEPNHTRTMASLDRAEKLAIADENFKQAAESKIVLSQIIKDIDTKLAALDDACEYQIRSGSIESARDTAEVRAKTASTKPQRVESEILLARIRYLLGDQQSALDDMDTIDKQLDKNRFTFGDRYPRLSASANIFLADHLKQKFMDMRLSDKSNLQQAVDQKSDIFASLSQRLDKVASLDQRDISPKARYQLALAAQDFADEIAALPARTGETLTLRSQTRFNQNMTRLRDLAKRYHSNNILAKQRAPQFYGNNEWIKKSAQALSNQGDASGLARDKQPRDQTTQATHMEVPQQWNF
jgi:hypothetical protein